MEADAGSRLGKPEQVAQSAVVAYREHGFLGKHPVAAILLLGVSPAVSLVALVALAAGALWVSDEACHRFGYGTEHWIAGLRQFGPSASVGLAYLESLLTVVIPSVLASVLYCWLAGRLGIGKK